MVVRVLPLPDKVDQQSSWQVTKDGVGQKSTHVKKSAALDAARTVARDGEARAIYGTDGGILEWKTTRKG